jgi:PQQ-dependent dehydrogenase (methanol/ethanol family)
MKRQTVFLAGAVLAAACTLGGGFGGIAAFGADMVTTQQLDHAYSDAKDWLTYHHSYRDYNYSALDQINTRNIKNLEVAWIHSPGRSNKGLQGTPLVYDGILYYSGSYSRVFALDGATGQVLWSFFPELDEALIAKQTHSPMNRGIAISHGKVYVGTIDGRLIALDMKTGKKLWDTKLIDSQKLTIGFSGAPIAVKDMVIIGSQGGEWATRGGIFAVDAETGKPKWSFYPAGADDAARKTWGNDSWKVGGSGGWQPGTFDPATNTVWWATSNPAPWFDWAGGKWMTEGSRAGINLYSTSLVALDADTGKLKYYFQEIPHNEWDFDSSNGEIILLDRGGQNLIVHANKSGFVFVLKEASAKVVNVYRLTENSNFVRTIDPKTGKMIGTHWLVMGPNKDICPAVFGAIEWPSGSYDPKTGLYYRAVQENCNTLTVKKAAPVTEPMAQFYLDGGFDVYGPNHGKPWGHVEARDPVTGKAKFSIRFPEPVLASLLSTGGNLLFVPDTRGWLRAYDATTGKELWRHNDGAGHSGGIISYMAHGKQYIAVTVGWASLSGLGYAHTYGAPYTSMATDTGMLVVYTLK